MAHQREVQAVLAMWREIDRALVYAEPGSSEFERLTDDAALLRDGYQLLVQEAQLASPSGLAGAAADDDGDSAG